MTSEQNNRCIRCSETIPSLAKFCPHCGANQDGSATITRLRPIHIAILLLCGTAVWVSAWYTQSSLSGVKPTKVFEKQSSIGNPKLHALKKTLEQNRDDLASWRSYADELISALQATTTPQSEDIFELIDALREILRLDPKDKGALHAMGDLSFNQKVFDKAAEYYKQLLEVAPNDTSVRSRYGSVLTFLNDFAGAERELNKVLSVKKDDFPATAYMAIVLAQKGEASKARFYADRAISLAPNAEAKKEFERFAASLKDQPEGVPLIPKAAAPGTQNANPKTSSFDTLVRNNPVAGPKFARSELIDNTTIKLFFNNFPMQAMPPMAKQKFFASIKEYLTKGNLSSITSIEFVDAENGATLERITP